VDLVTKAFSPYCGRPSVLWNGASRAPPLRAGFNNPSFFSVLPASVQTDVRVQIGESLEVDPRLIKSGLESVMSPADLTAEELTIHSKLSTFSHQHTFLISPFF